jgi:hypothetical protein
MPIPTMTHARLDGPLVMVGFGSIGKGTLPLILRHVGVAYDQPQMPSTKLKPSESWSVTPFLSPRSSFQHTSDPEAASKLRQCIDK